MIKMEYCLPKKRVAKTKTLTVTHSPKDTPISARNARKVARALKAAGYGSATIEGCRGYILNIASYFEPGDVEARHNVLDIICEAAGIQPAGEVR